MKNVLLTFSNGDIEQSSQLVGRIAQVFSDGGFPFDNVEILSTNDDILFNHNFLKLKDVADNLVIINNDNLQFNLKELIAEISETTLVENENAKRFVDAISERHGKVYSEDFAFLPIDATVIPNTDGAEQGYMLDDKEFTLAVLPSDEKQATVMSEKYILPFFENKYAVKVRKLTLKYFGDRKLLENTINQAVKIDGGHCKWSIQEKDGDFKVNFNFSAEANGFSSPVIRYVVEHLKDSIYAEFDTTLKERLFHILRLKNLKISTAESFTGGRVVSDIISNAGASETVVEGIVCYSNLSKKNRVGVNDNDLLREGAVSSIVAYQMAAGLLKTGNCDVAIATTGYAGPNGGENGKSGLCYIAVGMKNGVHTYKYNFSGSREQITEKAKNTALFLAIKNLKKI